MEGRQPARRLAPDLATQSDVPAGSPLPEGLCADPREEDRKDRSIDPVLQVPLQTLQEEETLSFATRGGCWPTLGITSANQWGLAGGLKLVKPHY